MSEGWTVRVDRDNDYETTTLFDVVARDSRMAEDLVRAFADCARNDAKSTSDQNQTLYGLSA